MSSKIIYFVRHGETLNNVLQIKQGPDGPLSVRGREQALATAKRFPKGWRGKPQIIVSSPYERTKETAEIIGNYLHLKVRYSDLLAERKNPSGIVGREAGDREVRKVLDKIDKSYHEDDLRIADEENFTDLKKRARKLLGYISRRNAKRIIMVTHSRFLKMIVSYMLYGEKLTASQYNTLSFFNKIDNAGMAICTYKHHWLKKNEWKLIVWNDLEK